MSPDYFKRLVHRLRVKLDSESITVYIVFAVVGVIFIPLAIQQHEWALALVLPALMLVAHLILCFDRYQTHRKQVAAEQELEAQRRKALEERLPDILLHIAYLDERGNAAKLDIITEHLHAQFADLSFGRWKKWPLPGHIQTKADVLFPYLTEAEREALFETACHVVFADHSYSAAERDTVEQLYASLQLPSQVAHRAFKRAQRVYVDARKEKEREAERERERRAQQEEEQARFREQWRRAFESEPELPPRAAALAELGLPENATEAAIRARFRKLAMQWHPDMHFKKGVAAKLEATERFKRIRKAYEAVCGPAA